MEQLSIWQGLSPSVSCRLHFVDPLASLFLGGFKRVDVIVVEGDAVGPQLSQLLCGDPRFKDGAGARAEGVDSVPADRPEPESEFIAWLWFARHVGPFA